MDFSIKDGTLAPQDKQGWFISFRDPQDNEVGKFYADGGLMKFEGKADLSAQIFIDEVLRIWNA